MAKGKGAPPASPWRDVPVLVTGAAGLLGAHVARDLVERAANVVVLLRDEVPGSELQRSGTLAQCTVVYGDVTHRETVERTINEYEIDTVFHLAAQTIVGTANRHPPGTFDTNVRGTWTVLEACRAVGNVRRILFASSDKAYGDAQRLPYTEDHPLHGKHPYDVSKSAADLIAQSYFHTYRLPVAITRCGNLYGAGDLNFNRIVPGTVRSVLRNERPVIRSDGSPLRDYFYVKDASLAYIALAEAMSKDPKVAGEAFNFSNEDKTSVLGVTRLILRIMGREDLKPDVRNETKGEILHQYLDCSKARKVLGWKPQWTLEKGIAETVEWYRDYLGSRK